MCVCVWYRFDLILGEGVYIHLCIGVCILSDTVLVSVCVHVLSCYCLRVYACVCLCMTDVGD